MRVVDARPDNRAGNIVLATWHEENYYFQSEIEKLKKEGPNERVSEWKVCYFSFVLMGNGMLDRSDSR